jgi:hypothetical protein
MGQSTDARLHYGVSFEDGAEFPWDKDHEGDFEDWWRDETGYKPLHKMWSDDGMTQLIPDEDPRKDAYYKHMFQWPKDHPAPVDIVTHCSGEYPMYLAVVPGTQICADRGEVIAVNPSDLTVRPEEEAALLAFLAKYNLEPQEGGPAWLLTSLWM